MTAPYTITDLIERDNTTPLSRRGFDGALYDSRLKANGANNATLTITIRVSFKIVDPSIRGGRVQTVNDRIGSTNRTYNLREISDPDLIRFKAESRRQSNVTWNNSLCLVPPVDFDLFDWPKAPETPSVRPNITCALDFIVTENPAVAHAIVEVVSIDSGVFSPNTFRSYVSSYGLGTRSGRWDLRDTGLGTSHVSQDDHFVLFFWNWEDINQLMIPHETGHLLGLPHIGRNLQVRSCVDGSQANKDPEYGDKKNLPMWVARDIMGMGPVVHAINARPWMHVMQQHVGNWGIDWIPAGVVLPPLAIKDLPKSSYTLENSPYQGGFQEVDRYE